jgi:hypothetical protein
MSRFAAQARTATGAYPTGTTGPAATFNGGPGYTVDDRTEVFLLSLTFLTTAYYESESERVKRYADAVRRVAETDPEWLAGYLKWLRQTANIRTAAIVGGVEAARVLGNQRYGPGRDILDSVLRRPDEPAEALAYHLATHGKPIPAAVRKGIADAAERVYNEYAAIKYANQKAAVQPGDVIALCHPNPRNAVQSQTFTYLMDLRHKRADPRVDGLDIIAAYRSWTATPTLDLPDGLPWEMALSRGVEAGLSRRALWEALIDGDKLGYMALIRNMSNLVDASVSDQHLDTVASRIADPTRVLASKQLPFRFLSAYRAASMRFQWPLQQALNTSLANWPTYPGRTLIALDTSASMRNPVGGKNSTVTAVESGSLFVAALAARNRGSVDVGLYATDCGLVSDLPPDALHACEQINAQVGRVGHGTNTWPSVAAMLNRVQRPDRVVVVTDGQDNPSRGDALVPADIPVYVFDVAGYRNASIDGSRGRYLLSGLNDTLFTLPPLLESGSAGRWPWQT